MNFVNFAISALVLIVSISIVVSQGVDQTLVEGTYGKDVTEASLRKMQRSGVFPDDQNFMRRLAWVETQFGESSKTYRSGYDGGIWQLDEVYYAHSKSQSLSQFHDAIASNFSINWKNTTWRDCRKPFYSALGARLYFSSLNQAIPGTINLQGDFWVNNYRRDGGNQTYWADKVDELEKEPICSSSMDICMVLDGSQSVEPSNFIKAKEFIAEAATLMRSTSANANSTRIALVEYSEKSTTYFNFANNLTIAELNSTIRNVFYSNGRTNTTGALFTAVQLHKAASPRPGVPKVVATFTDGNTNVDTARLPEAINQIRNASLKSFAIGIGSEISQAELMQIALNDPANVFSVDGFDSLKEFVYRLNSETCELPQEPEVGENRTDSCKKDEFKYYSYSIPPEGLTIRVDVNLGSLNGWYSYTERTPNSAMYDGVIVNGWGYVAPSPTKTRQSGDDRVYVSLQGTESSNEFTVSSMTGNQVPNGSDAVLSSSVCLFVSLIIALFKFN